MYFHQILFWKIFRKAVTAKEGKKRKKKKEKPVLQILDYFFFKGL